MQLPAVAMPSESDVKRLQALLTVKHQPDATPLPVVAICVEGSSAKILDEGPVLEVVVGLPQQHDADRIATHDRVEELGGLTLAPNEVALDCRQHDLLF